MSIRFLITTLMDPVFLVSVWLAALSLWMFGKPFAKSVKTITWFLMSIMWVSATPSGANWLLSHLESPYRDTQPCNLDEYSAIVVLAGGTYGTLKDAEDIAKLQIESYRRVVGILDFSEIPAKYPVILAGAGTGLMSEATAMAALIRQLDIPPLNLIEENISRNTHEGSVQVGLLLRSKGLDREICLVTSAIHMSRAIGAFSKEGIRVSPYAVDHRFIDVKFVDGLVPQISSLAKSVAAYHEYLGLFWYRLNGYI